MWADYYRHDLSRQWPACDARSQRTVIDLFMRMFSIALSDRGKRLRSRRDRLLHHLVVVRQRDERGLELRWGQVDLAVEHGVKEARVAGGVGMLLGRGVVGDR